MCRIMREYDFLALISLTFGSNDTQSVTRQPPLPPLTYL